MQVHIEESRKLRRASASIRDGGIIHVKLPRHWSRELKHSITEELVGKLQKRDAKEKALLALAAAQPSVTLSTQAELEAFVHTINQETFQVPLGKVQIGYAKYNHLAQVNLRTKVMTISRYCLTNAPAHALRYLIVHELAHYFESGHGPRFWALVAKHVPDHKQQSRIMKAFHHQAVIQESQQEETATEAAASTTLPELVAPRKTTNVLPPKSGYASKPASSPKVDNTPASEPKQKNKTGLLPGFVRQLLLWGER